MPRSRSSPKRSKRRSRSRSRFSMNQRKRYTQLYAERSPDYSQIFSDFKEATPLPEDLIWLTMEHLALDRDEKKFSEPIPLGGKTPEQVIEGVGKIQNGRKVGVWNWKIKGTDNIALREYYDSEGRLHNDDGPAVQSRISDKWYIHGKRVGSDYVTRKPLLQKDHRNYVYQTSYQPMRIIPEL